MTKSELASLVAGKAGIAKKGAETAINAVLEAISETLGKGESISLVGFGTFKVSKRAAREGRNPRTGAKLKIPAAKVVKFTPGKKLKEKVK